MSLCSLLLEITKLKKIKINVLSYLLINLTAQMSSLHLPGNKWWKTKPTSYTNHCRVEVITATSIRAEFVNQPSVSSIPY